MAGVGVEFAAVSFSPVPGHAVIDNVTLSLAPGVVTALLGTSGSGKTTLLRMVNGLVMPSAGEVRVDGRSTAASDLLALRRSIGYVIQETGLFPHWTVARNVGLALELADRSREECDRRAAELLQAVGLEAGLRGRYPWQLSGGQRQRVGLARALAADPGVLLMDEPFGALDPMTRAEMQDMLRTLLGRAAKTVLLVTHDLDEALYLASRIVFLERGRVVADLPTHEVRASENEYVRRYVAATHRGDAA